MTAPSIARPAAATIFVSRQRVGRVFLYTILVIIGVVLFTPFILAFLGTFKTNVEIIAWPPSFFPAEWLWENWPTLWNTDFGGLPRAEGSTSLGLMAGLLVFFATFMLTGLSSEKEGEGLPRLVGLPVAIVLAILAGVASGLYLNMRFDASIILRLTIGISITVIALIGVGILSMSQPDWRRVILALLGALLAGAIATLFF